MEVAIVIGEGHHAGPTNAILEAEVPQNDGGVARDLDAGPDFLQVRSLLIDDDVKPELPTGDRGRQPADAATRNQHTQLRLPIK
jgi:hypothetical protein